MCIGNIEEETRSALEAVRRILRQAGADLSDVVRMTVFLEDARDFGRYNRVFAEYFPDLAASRAPPLKPVRSPLEDRDRRHRLQAISSLN